MLRRLRARSTLRRLHNRAISADCSLSFYWGAGEGSVAHSRRPSRPSPRSPAWRLTPLPGTSNRSADSARRRIRWRPQARTGRRHARATRSASIRPGRCDRHSPVHRSRRAARDATPDRPPADRSVHLQLQGLSQGRMDEGGRRQGQYRPRATPSTNSRFPATATRSTARTRKARRSRFTTTQRPSSRSRARSKSSSKLVNRRLC